MQKETRLSEAKQRLLEIHRRGGLIRTAAAAAQLIRHARKNPAPLSLAQEQVWRLDQTAGKLASLHNESITIHRRGPCDPAVLERSLVEIIRRHEIWRTTFESVAGQPVQIVHPAPATFKLPIADLRSLPESRRWKTALDLASEDAKQSFDLSQGPLMRARLVTLDDAEHCLFVSAHQMIVDGITVFDIFPSELTSLYESLILGKPSPLPELKVQYGDFACWQRCILTGDVLENQLTYWRNQLAGDLPVLHWPLEAARPACQTYRGAIHPFQLNRQLTESLRNLGRREGVTLFMILLSTLMTLLHKYTSQQDLIVGTLAPSGRTRSEFQRLMGYFLNPVPLRANLSSDPRFSELLRRMREVTLDAISNSDVTLELVAERLRVKSEPSRSPFFTVALSIAPDVPQLPTGWSMTYMDVQSGGGRWDLYLEINGRAEGMIGRAQYNPDLFTTAKITQTLEDLRLLLERVASDAGEPISRLVDNTTGT